MTTKTKTNAKTENARPTHGVFQVTEKENGKKFWTRLGAAWAHKDGKGFNIRLKSLPVQFDGNLVLREPNNNEEGEGE